VSTLVLVTGLAGTGCSPAAAPVTVEIVLRYSRFQPAAVQVPHGRPVTFVLRNEDPIDHEWIVGDDALHEAHRQGTEAHHGTRPTEVSVDPLATRRTTVTFSSATRLTFVCHLPGHEAYGMVGELAVL
jgi:uncharacterized cupredoxin-like copper-binding protein